MTEENIENTVDTNTEIITDTAEVISEETSPEVVAEIKEEVKDEKKEEVKTFAGRAPFKRGETKLGKDGKPMRGPRKFGSGRPERAKPEFEQKTLDVRRVTRVVSGGRRFSFSVAVVIGDRKGRVGLGLGKAGDTALAIDKAYKQAQKKMVQLKLTKDNSVPHEMMAKFNSSYITIMPNKGRGLIAGSSARIVFALAGIQNITAKLHSGSKNKLNNARVAIKALEAISSPYEKKNRPASEIAEGKTFSGRSGGRDGAGSGRPPRKNNFFVKRTVDATKAPSMDNNEPAEAK